MKILSLTGTSGGQMTIDLERLLIVRPIQQEAWDAIEFVFSGGERAIITFDSKENRDNGYKFIQEEWRKA